MKKAIICAFMLVALFASCSHEDENYLSLGYTNSQRELLFDFIGYCQGCTGLEQNCIKPKKSDCDILLKRVARYYGDQENFADVTDYWEQADVDRLIYD